MSHTDIFVFSEAAPKVRKLADDRDHCVVLDEPFFVGTFREIFSWVDRDLPILPFENDKLSIGEDRRLVLKVVDKPHRDAGHVAGSGPCDRPRSRRAPRIAR